MNIKSDSVENNQKRQKYLGDKGLVVLIAFLSAFIPLSTDLYLPALPLMTKNLNAPASLINLTLTCFFVFYAVATLFWGPLSDKYGRKRILLIGLFIYTLASTMCALSGNVYQLILFRILQAIGSGAVTSVATAVVKDVYSGRKLESILAIVQSMVMLAPIVAPVIGAFILSITSWRGVFWGLSVLGLIATTGSIAMEETIDQRHSGSILQSIARLGVVAKNKNFTTLLVTFSLIGVPFMAFITASSYIYVNGFGVSEQIYSYYFAFNAIFLVIGPLLYIKLSKHFKSSSIIVACFGVMGLSGLFLGTIGNIKPWLFAVSLLPATLFGGIIRPPSANLILEQQKEDIGAASSLMGFTYTMFGCIGMTMISFNWANRILVIGLMYVLTSLASLALWLTFSKSHLYGRSSI